MWQGIDRRRFPRAHYRCKIIVVRKRRKERLVTYTENIGLGGVCVILDRELDKFSEAELMIYLEDGQPPLDCLGRVVWVIKRGSPDPNKPDAFDTGIEFLSLKDKDKLRIERIVQECLLKET
ncbi:MAG: PilZ domain-containing protein [Candidatus Omnitrophica bacterium]|nr:PilZ domain-containing protein [Candidatus Omnitrophota bacterium]